MRLVAIDPGSNYCGVYDGNNLYTLNLNPTKNAKRPERLANLYNELADMLSCNWYDFVVYETPFCRGRDATRCLWGVAGIIEAAAHYHGAGIIDVANTALRRWATGTGKKQVKDKGSKSNPMFVKARELAPPVFWGKMNEHEADAICLYHYTLEKAVYNA